MTNLLLSTFIAAAGVASAQIVYNGNGDVGFGGAVGQGSLTISNNPSGVLDFTFTRGTGNFNDAIVLYFDSVAGGHASTGSFTDAADGLRKAISGIDGGSNRSTLNFSGGFGADYAIALNQGFAGLWSLSNTSSYPFLLSANLSPTGVSQASYTFSINVADIGLTANSGQTFTFFGSYVSESGFRSTETFGAGYTAPPAQGWNTFNAAGSNSFTTVPEPSTIGLFGLGFAALLGGISRRRARK